MRSIRLLAGATAISMAAWGCGDNGGGTEPPPNRAPTAEFSASCTGLTCTFTNESTDPDEGTTLTHVWAFGDGNTAGAVNPTHTYQNAGQFNVTLTVSDGEGGTNAKIETVTTTGPANTPPTAAFTFQCDAAGACTFNSSTSTDLDGNIASYLWDFGDPGSGASNSSTEPNPTHTYTVTTGTDFNVKLTVTDNGGATDDVTQVVAIGPPASVLCTVVDPRRVDCTHDFTQRATLTITVTSRQCEIGGNRFEIVQPIQRTVFFNGCSVPVNTQYTPTDGSGAPVVFEAGTPVVTRFTQGTGIDPGDPTPGTPQVTREGAFPEWTLRIDDGGAPGQPRNDDIVLTLTATPR